MVARQQSTREAATRPGRHATNASAGVEELITLVIRQCDHRHFAARTEQSLAGS
jgi:hypothetical protein